MKRVRGQVRGPWAVWLGNADLAEYALELYDLFASRVKLERRLVQLIILALAALPQHSLPGSLTSRTRVNTASHPK